VKSDYRGTERKKGWHRPLSDGLKNCPGGGGISAEAAHRKLGKIDVRREPSDGGVQCFTPTRLEEGSFKGAIQPLKPTLTSGHQVGLFSFLREGERNNTNGGLTGREIGANQRKAEGEFQGSTGC